MSLLFTNFSCNRNDQSFSTVLSFFSCQLKENKETLHEKLFEGTAGKCPLQQTKNEQQILSPKPVIV